MTTPVNQWSSLGNKHVWKLRRVLEDVVAARVGKDEDRKVELTVRG
jgi:hypothetical protein